MIVSPVGLGLQRPASVEPFGGAPNQIAEAINEAGVFSIRRLNRIDLNTNDIIGIAVSPAVSLFTMVPAVAGKVVVPYRVWSAKNTVGLGFNAAGMTLAQLRYAGSTTNLLSAGLGLVFGAAQLVQRWDSVAISSSPLTSGTGWLAVQGQALQVALSATSAITAAGGGGTASVWCEYLIWDIATGEIT